MLSGTELWLAGRLSGLPAAPLGLQTVRLVHHLGHRLPLAYTAGQHCCSLWGAAQAAGMHVCHSLAAFLVV